ncbi:MAG: hypothetical protein F2903_06230 [Actinobacteria bacterium]|jgi:hypothetical protein|uniref:Unannotated protein n=1 Tax=freshwater metagenome TaxID=449393 RepID=A0A6J7RCM9_9ZZZZ|nr:hypothetical protein [Actinomycetota bacterium]MSX09133.1 hypothetical protein [Actinomycetota bacterium]
MMSRQSFRRSPSRAILITGVLTVVSLGAAACGSSSSSSTTTTKATSATTTTMAAPTTTAAAAPTTTLPCTPSSQQTNSGPPATQCLNEYFNSPSKNIGCQIRSQAVYCQSINQPNSVTLAADGTVKPCSGQNCLGNGPTGVQILAYGSSVTNFGFTCKSATTGVTCTVASGKGFMINDATVTTLS